MKKKRRWVMWIGLLAIWVVMIQEFLVVSSFPAVEKGREEKPLVWENEWEKEPDFSSWYENLAVVKGTVPYVDVWDIPSEDGISIGKMLPGSGIDMVRLENGYAAFLQDGMTGWVKTEHLLTGKEAAEAAKQEAVYCAVLTEDAEVKKQAKEGAETVHRLVAGDCYPITEENEDWVRIKIRGDFGGYVEKEKTNCGYQLEKPVMYGDTTGSRTNLVNTAWKYYGGKYVWGGTTLGVGVDCSGFVLRLYELFDVQIPRVSYEQAASGEEISFGEIQPGDLIFYNVEGGRVDHVAMYTGNHKIIHAASSSSGICVANWNYLPVVCIRRYI